MTDEKIETFKKTKPVDSLKDVQHFLGFANFYRRFMKDYSKICLPLTKSTSLDPRDWKSTPEIKASQGKLTELSTSPPILNHFDPNLQAIVEIDASNYVLGGIHSQKHSEITPCRTPLAQAFSAELTTTSATKSC